MYSIGDAATAANRMPPGPRDALEIDVEGAGCGGNVAAAGNDELNRWFEGAVVSTRSCDAMTT